MLVAPFESNEGATLHLQISAGWNHAFSLEPAKPGGVQVDVGDLQINMDPWSATRANGLKIELTETLTGTSFSFENPRAASWIRCENASWISPRSKIRMSGVANS